jgi:hypothetical protein
LGNGFSQVQLVVLGQPNVVATRLDNLHRQLTLREEGISHHHLATQIQTMQQTWGSREFVFVAGYGYLHQHHPFSRQVSR